MAYSTYVTLRQHLIICQMNFTRLQHRSNPYLSVETSSSGYRFLRLCINDTILLVKITTQSSLKY